VIGIPGKKRLLQKLVYVVIFLGCNCVDDGIGDLLLQLRM